MPSAQLLPWAQGNGVTSKISQLQEELNIAQSNLSSTSNQLSQDIEDLAPDTPEVDTSSQTGIGYF